MRRPVPALRRAFTLIELLLAVFILGIGIISVSALFPAGIAQQQRALDDQLGPVVAEAALGILRNRVDTADFGSFESHAGSILAGQPPTTDLTVLAGSSFRSSYVYRPALGDWSWIRPSRYSVNAGGWVAGRFPDGAIDIFGSDLLASATGPGGQGQSGTYQHEFRPNPMGAVRGIPYNLGRIGRDADLAKPPAFVVTQRERCWPAIPEGEAGDGVRPEYQWECLFRRSGGRIQVAIFVFRVVSQGGASRLWVSPDLLPIRRVLASSSSSDGQTLIGAGNQPPVATPWVAGDNPAFPGPYTSGTIGIAQGLQPTDVPGSVWHQWQLPGQWIVDNYANVHRVRKGRILGGPSESVEVRLSAPIPLPPAAEPAGDYERQTYGNLQLQLGMRTFHFIPGIVDGGTVQLVPVYAIVRDL